MTSDRGTTLICIPDRMSAEMEVTRLQREHGPRLIKAFIGKDKPSKRFTADERKRCSTYTLRYFIRVTEEVPLF